MKTDQTENLPMQEQQKLLQEFMELQKQELATKQKEQENRKDEIQANERIALASIEAQKSSDLQHGEVFKEIYKRRLHTIITISALVVIVIVAALWLNKDQVALEFIKIGGAVLLGYFAGVNRGKAEVLEKQQRQDNSD